MITQPATHATPLPEFGDDIYAGTLTVRLPGAILRELARIDVGKTVAAIASEWLAIFGAIALCHFFWNPLLYAIAIPFVGGRQHALAVLQHDAAHFRLLPNKKWNDLVAEVFLAWPILLSNQYFREYHFLHHRHIGTTKDGNRAQYGTHTPDGELIPSWNFPKSKIHFALWVLPRLSGIAGIIYILRSIHRLFTKGTLRYRLLNLLYYTSILGLILWFHGGQILLLYWFVPLSTWFVFTNLLRIAGEHSAITNSDEFYCLTRTTLPSWFDRLFIVPRHISYHLEHHLYPHIPFYRLPNLHAELMKDENFRQQAHVTRTYWQTLKELVV
ncbi:fatty acid desaturase family protein [Pseudanabaena sp. PCC 6802]|uniref:fatty acid desaturase family protein n=1 Tax=Pseudanabaena sp. PCC 6802 TaxID=118173 RepID=UPI000349B9D9|nr:fatty acid desaturase family protein [Pseudanabaena sp. PCC 6802]